MHLLSRWPLAGLVIASLAVVAQAKELQLTPVQIERLQIEVRKAEAATDAIITALPAMVVPPSNSRIAVSAPFAGNVLQVAVIAGQTVAEGEELARIASRDGLDAIARLEQARIELKATEVVAQRMRALFREKSIALKQLEEAEAQLDKARVVLEQAERTVRIGGVKPASDGSFSLHAPKAGRIVEVRVAAGATLEALATAVLIDSLEEFWLQIQLPARVVAKVRIGDKVTTESGATGDVIAVSPALDPVYRSAVLLARLPKDASLIAGQTLGTTISRPAESGILKVPTRAVVWQGGEAHVFVRTSAGFSMRPVTVVGGGVAADGDTTLKGDLGEGEEVATTGLAHLEKLAPKD